MVSNTDNPSPSKTACMPKESIRVSVVIKQKGGSKSGMGGQSLGAWLEAVHSCLVLVVVLACQTGLSTPKEAQRQRGRVLCSQKGTCKRSSVGSILKHPARSLTQKGVLFLKTVDK